MHQNRRLQDPVPGFDAIVGPTLFKIPAEEIFFFIIQTYNTSILYLLASKPTFHPIYLVGGSRGKSWELQVQRWTGILVLVALILAGAGLVARSGEVFGLVAFDNALAILNVFPTLFPATRPLPSPIQLVKALLVPVSQYDDQRIDGLREALERLRRKSRSFYLASGCFQGRLRIDLILLYSFCRVADDLVDEAPSGSEAKHWILKLTEYLDICYASRAKDPERRHNYVIRTFPPKAQSALLLLPTEYLSPPPLYDLVKGFETDLAFSSDTLHPIEDEETLQQYGSRVAGTVAELCLELAFHHSNEQTTEQQRRKIIKAGGWMGIALQYVNISRDIKVDAINGRVYIPKEWLESSNLKPESVINDPCSAAVETLRQRLLNIAMKIYGDAKGAIELLPSESRGPMRVAVESYVEIGRVLQEGGYKLKAGRATVPKARRLRVAWTALRKG
ncbi:MAG: hypothetical protein Q9207_006043 [Kuettlingeria erythrocarpa]